MWSPSREFFDQEKLELYASHFAEEYNVFHDHDYISWLKLYHPDLLQPKHDLSLTEIFSSVTPEIPISVVGTKQQSDDVTHMNELAVSLTLNLTYLLQTMTLILSLLKHKYIPTANTRNSSSSGKGSTV